LAAGSSFLTRLHQAAMAAERFIIANSPPQGPPQEFPRVSLALAPLPPARPNRPGGRPATVPCEPERVRPDHLGAERDGLY
jgi:hypothetical protein